MNKGIFFIPVNDQNKEPDSLFDEIIEQTINAENWGLAEAFFGEHITDRHEKITSSLMMISAVSQLTKKIKLGTLTTNLNFYKPATISAMISQVDNLSKGRLTLGIGSGANKSDVEAIDMLEKDNHKIMLETYKIIEEIFKKQGPLDIKTENFNVSTKKTFNEKHGLGFFNKLYNERQDLEVMMPALNKDSYNVRICAENNWSIVISNFCSDYIVDNHINNYLKYTKLNRKEALKKIKLTKLIYVNDNNKDSEKYVLSEKSPYLKVVDIIFKKLKTFNKHGCFGENILNSIDALKNIALYGSPDAVKSKIEFYKSKYGDLSSIIYIGVPKTNLEVYDSSLEKFAKNV